MKTRAIYILLFIICCSTVNSQNWLVNHYKTTTHKNFRSNKLFKEKINFRMIDYTRLNAAIFFVTNEERVKNNCLPVNYHKMLENTAGNYAKRMARLKFFSHNDPYNDLLKTPSDRMRLAGITNPYAAENIATPFAILYEEGEVIYPLDDKDNYFSYTPNGRAIPNHTYISLAEYVVDLWMNSEGHRKNILNPDALQLGCGTFFYRERGANIPKFMAVQNFQLYEAIIEEKD